MVEDDFFSESREVRELVSQLEDVSKLPPREVLHYLLELSELTLSLYIMMRDALPRGYGRIKFSRFVEKKRRQVENMRYIARELYPGAGGKTRVPTPSFSIETVGDYVKVLRNAVYLESLSLKAFRYLARSTGEKLLFSDLAEEIEDNISELRREIQRAESVESRVRFSEFVKELVGGGDE